MSIDKKEIRDFLLPWSQWWPMIMGVAGLLLVYFAYAIDWQWELAKGTQEIVAPYILSLAMGVYIGRAVSEKEPAWQVLAVLSFIFMIREIHFHHTTKPTYVALAIWAAWVFAWRDRLVPMLEKGAFKNWLFAAGFAYVFSQMVGQRWLRYVLPYEHHLHVSMEETMENFAHLTLLITAFSDRFRGPRRKAGAAPARTRKSTAGPG